MKKRLKVYILISIVLAAIIIIASLISTYTQKSDMAYTDFLFYVGAEEIEHVTLIENSHYFYASLKGSTEVEYKVINPKTDNFTEFLLLHNITVTYDSGAFLPFYLQMILVGALFVFLICLGLEQRKKALIKDAMAEKQILYTLSDIAGHTEAKYMVQDVIRFIKHPEAYAKVGARMPRGILFYGPPGTGKTLMAKAIAGEAQVPFYAMSGSDFVQTYVGVGASRVRDLFRKAKKSKKAVIFIDEIDAIGKTRGNGLSASNDERDQTLNALLTEMSGFHERDGIVVIAATNRVDTLDEALLRPGRFDRQIEITLPDLSARREILKLHLKNKPVSDDLKMEDLAKSTVYFSGAMLENLINEAAILTANKGGLAIDQDSIEKSFYTVIAGAPKNDRSALTKNDLEVTAYHEAGHALMTKLLLKESTVSSVTIIPSTKGAGGFSLSIPKESSYLSKDEIGANIMVLLAGRAAEEIRFGKNLVTTGAGNDLEKASSLMLDYIYQYGMDEDFGIFQLPKQNIVSQASYIERAREKMNLFYAEAIKELKANDTILKSIADELLEKETLHDADLVRLMKAS